LGFDDFDVLGVFLSYLQNIFSCQTSWTLWNFRSKQFQFWMRSQAKTGVAVDTLVCSDGRVRISPLILKTRVSSGTELQQLRLQGNAIPCVCMRTFALGHAQPQVNAAKYGASYRAT
jgi:hypothetical protein